MKNWDDFRYFLAVAETGSLSAAARMLGVTQPTVGRRIQVLESRLSTNLFDHLSHGYALTEPGESILEQVRQLDQLCFDIERKIRGQDQSLSGKVVITTTEGLSAFWLAQQLKAFHAECPDIDVDILVALSPLDLLRREADIALRMGSPQSDLLIGRKIGRVHFGLYASSNYLETHGRPQSLDQLGDHSIIESSGEMAGLVQAESLRSHAAGASRKTASNNAFTQIALLRAATGIVPLPCYMAAGLNDVERVLADKFDISLDLWLLTVRDLRQNKRIQVMMDFLAAALRQDADIFTGHRDHAD